MMQGSRICTSMEVSADLESKSLSDIFSVRNIKFAVQGSENQKMFRSVSHPLAEIFKKGLIYTSVYTGLSRSECCWWAGLSQ